MLHVLLDSDSTDSTRQLSFLLNIDLFYVRSYMYLYFTNNGSRSIKYSKHNIQQNKRVLSSKSSAAGVASDKGDAIIIIIIIF